MQDRSTAVLRERLPSVYKRRLASCSRRGWFVGEKRRIKEDRNFGNE